MTFNPDRQEQDKYILDLISRVLDGAPSEHVVQELLSQLKTSKHARIAWCEAISTHAELGLLVNPPRPFSAEELLSIDARRSLASLDSTEIDAGVRSASSLAWPASSQRRLLLASLTCLAATVVFFAFLRQQLVDVAPSHSGATPTPTVKAPQPIASFVRCVGSDLLTDLGATNRLSAGQVIEFSRGLVELKVNHGVRVVAYAPARLRINAPDEISLDFGRVSVDVDKGYEGFRVSTDNAIVTDLGTTFSVEADANGHSTVRVHAGEVNVQSQADTRITKRVSEGHEVRVAERVLDPQQNAPDLPTRAPLLSLATPHRVVPCKQDTYIVGGNFSDMIAGHSHLLLVKLDIRDPSFCRQAWIDFDLSDIPRKSLLAAKLVLNVEPNDLADVKEPGNARSDCNWMFEVGGMWNDKLPEWDELTMTWNNAPGHDITTFPGMSVGPSMPQSLGQFTIHGRGAHGEQATIDTPTLADFIRADSDGRITLLVSRKTGYTWSSHSEDRVIHSFSSRESDTLPPPTLELWFE